MRESHSPHTHTRHIGGASLAIPNYPSGLAPARLPYRRRRRRCGGLDESRCAIPDPISTSIARPASSSYLCRCALLAGDRRTPDKRTDGFCACYRFVLWCEAATGTASWFFANGTRVGATARSCVGLASLKDRISLAKTPPCPPLSTLPRQIRLRPATRFHLISIHTSPWNIPSHVYAPRHQYTQLPRHQGHSFFAE